MPMNPNEARLGVNYGGNYGELRDPVNADASKDQIRQWIGEAIRTGGIPGIAADPNVDIDSFVIEDPMPPTEARDYTLIQARPKTPYGV